MDSPHGATSGMSVPAVIGDAYDLYASELYAYCRFQLLAPADALDALEDTFLVAVGRLAALPPDRQLRTWLFAVARNQCLYRGGPRRAATAPGPPPGETPGGPEGHELLPAAIEGLAPDEHDLIAMLWHGLEIDDMALVLGISRDAGFPLMSQALGQLETATAALLVARSGRRPCAGLRALLGDWDGRLTVALTRRISQHAERCQLCSARRREELRPALLLSLTPGALLGAGVTAPALRPTDGTVDALRDQVLSLACDTSPEGEAARERACERTGPFRSPPVDLSEPAAAGFPLPMPAKAGGVLRTPRSRLVAGLTVAAVAVVAAAVTVTVTVAGGGGGTHAADTGLAGLSRTPASASAATTAGASLPSDSASPVRSAKSPTPSASPSPPAPPPSSAPSPSASPPPRSPAPSARPAPAVHVPSRVVLEWDSRRRELEGALPVTVDGGPVSWFIYNPNRDLRLSRESGTSSASVLISGTMERDEGALLVRAGERSFMVTLTAGD